MEVEEGGPDPLLVDCMSSVNEYALGQIVMALEAVEDLY
jgi:hypothetical protein